MKFKMSPVDAKSIKYDTDKSKHYADKSIRQAYDAIHDTKREQRLFDNQCKFCFYIHPSRIGGAAMTTTECGVCGKEIMFGSTAVDKICPECAREKELCRRCGAEVDFKTKEPVSE